MARRSTRRTPRRPRSRSGSARRSYGRRTTYTARARARKPARRRSASGRQGRIVIEVVQQQPVRAGEMLGMGTVATRGPRLKPAF